MTGPLEQSPIPEPAPGSVRETESESSAPEAGPGGISWFRIAIWLVLYGAILVAWGQRNSWPDELILSLLTLPVNLVVGWLLYDEHGFGLGSDPRRSQQEQLISALILALGVASGQRLFMALGLVALGVSWLRPRRPGVDWLEWLKLPFLFLTILPVWLDFEGGRVAVAALFGDPFSNPVYRLILGIEINQAAMLFYFGLIAMILVLPGAIFWVTFPGLPLYILGITLVPRAFPSWVSLPPVLRLWLPWIIGPLLLSLAHLVASRYPRRASNPEGESVLATRWFAQRRYSPWLAVLVVAAVQVPTFAPVRWNWFVVSGFVGIALTLTLLAWLRRRSPRGPIHSRSVAFVASAVALALLGEFATRDEPRRLGLAIAFIGLLSWQRFWSLRIFIAAGLAACFFLGLPPESAVRGLSHPVLLGLKIGGGTFFLGLLAWFAFRPLPIPGEKGYADESWVPPKRFALILLVLVLLFQIAGAFWPDHDLPPVADWEPSASNSAEDAGHLTTPAGFPGSGTPMARRALSWNVGPAQLTVAELRSNPSILESPERILIRRGWKIRTRLPVEFPGGEGSAILAEHQGTSMTMLWWFEHEGHQFANHLYARRILWSSWHLADRHLRLIRLESAAFHTAEELVDFARRNDWFASHLSPPASVRPP